jgi:ABC-2 type transport system ATP-binding protein
MAVIEAHELSKRFGNVQAVDRLSFAVDPGTVTGFLGPNGAGKTTTLRMLLGLVSPTAGAATVGGAPYRRLADPARTVGAVLEASDFHPGRSARNHLRIQCAAAGLPPSRADEALGQVGLAEVGRRRVGGFSLGMRQRLGLAAALLGDPQVLILDEPANGLDPEGVHWLRGFLRHFAGQGRTVLVSSHVLAEIAQTVDQVVIIAHGRLIVQSRLDALGDGAAPTLRIRTPQAEALRALLAANAIQCRLMAPDLLMADGVAGEQVGPLVARAGIVVFEMTPQGTNLEDVFLQLTSGAGEAPA